MFGRQTSWAFSFKFFSLSSATLSSLLGVDKVIQYAVTEWLTDIRKNQLPGILGGVGPMHSVVQLCELKLLQTHCCTQCQLNIYMLFIQFLFSSLLVHSFPPISTSLHFSSPWSEGSVLVAHRAVQEGWTHYSRSPEGGSILRHLHSICCSGAQQQAGAGHTGTQSVKGSQYRAQLWIKVIQRLDLVHGLNLFQVAKRERTCWRISR